MTSLNMSFFHIVQEAKRQKKNPFVAIQEEICNFLRRLQEVFVNLFRVLDARLLENS